MSSPSDPEDLVSRLATGLDSGDRESFRHAAEAALAALPPQAAGPGSTYRTVAPIWRKFYHPPREVHTGWSCAPDRVRGLIRDGSYPRWG